MFTITNYPDFSSRIGAISVKKFLTSVNLIREIDAITFEAFILRKPVAKLWKGACVVREKCSTHRGK
jgi:hypothetical protein